MTSIEILVILMGNQGKGKIIMADFNERTRELVRMKEGRGTRKGRC